MACFFMKNSHQASIHESRLMAWMARSIPFLLVFFNTSLAIYGALVDIRILLLQCAILNTTVWLWITSTALYAISAAYESSINVRQFDESGSKERAADVHHLVVFPNYKEDDVALDQTLQSLSEAVGSNSFSIVLAMEEREGDVGREKAGRLQDLFADNFESICSTYHPATLQQQLMDGTTHPEVPGKASNLRWAVARSHEACLANGLDPKRVVLTVADADCLFHPDYFRQLGLEFDDLSKRPGDKQFKSMWQAPQLPFRNYYPSPIPSRAWGYIASMYEAGGVASLTGGWNKMVFSAYSVSLDLANAGDLWDGDVIAEDHHAFLKASFFSIQKVVEDGDFEQCVRVRPIMLPVKCTSVESPGGALQGWIERWHQAKRHCQGVAELSYSLLSAFDLLCSAPVNWHTFKLVQKLWELIASVLFMHVVPVCQGVSLGVLSVYWYWYDMNIPGCGYSAMAAMRTNISGETLVCGLAGAWSLVWPVAIPMSLLMIVNYYFLSVVFVQPQARSSRGLASRTLWNAEGGKIPKIWGSTKLAVLVRLASDLLLVGPVMVIYGFLPELLASWNVLLYGNSFNYITAAKGSAEGPTSETGKGSLPLAQKAF